MAAQAKHQDFEDAVLQETCLHWQNWIQNFEPPFFLRTVVIITSKFSYLNLNNNKSLVIMNDLEQIRPWELSHSQQVTHGNASHANSSPSDPQVNLWTALLLGHCFNALSIAACCLLLIFGRESEIFFLHGMQQKQRKTSLI